jgi:hypothetical protein
MRGAGCASRPGATRINRWVANCGEAECIGREHTQHRQSIAASATLTRLPTMNKTILALLSSLVLVPGATHAKEANTDSQDL